MDHVKDPGHIGPFDGMNRLPETGIAVAGPVVALGPNLRPGRDDGDVVRQCFPIGVVNVGGQCTRALVPQPIKVWNRVSDIGRSKQVAQISPAKTIHADDDGI